MLQAQAPRPSEGNLVLEGLDPARAGAAQVIRQLADAGARLDLKNARGQTALDQIAGKSRTAVRSPDRVNRGPRETTVELLRSLSAGTRPGRD